MTSTPPTQAFPSCEQNDENPACGFLGDVRITSGAALYWPERSVPKKTEQEKPSWWRRAALGLASEDKQ